MTSSIALCKFNCKACLKSNMSERINTCIHKHKQGCVNTIILNSFKLLFFISSSSFSLYPLSFFFLHFLFLFFLYFFFFFYKLYRSGQILLALAKGGCKNKEQRANTLIYMLCNSLCKYTGYHKKF